MKMFTKGRTIIAVSIKAKLIRLFPKFPGLFPKFSFLIDPMTLGKGGPKCNAHVFMHPIQTLNIIRNLISFAVFLLR